MNIEARVKELLHGLLGEDMSDVTRACQLRERLGIDSIELVEIALLIEQTFGVRVAKPKELKTFGDLCRAASGGQSEEQQPEAAE